jgi:hypothetical protein
VPLVVIGDGPAKDEGLPDDVVVGVRVLLEVAVRLTSAKPERSQAVNVVITFFRRFSSIFCEQIGVILDPQYYNYTFPPIFFLIFMAYVQILDFYDPPFRKLSKLSV